MGYSTFYWGSIRATMDPLALKPFIDQYGDIISDKIQLQSSNGYLFLEVKLIGLDQEIEVKGIIQGFIEYFKNAEGDMCCYGEDIHDIRRIVVKDNVIYEMKGELKFDYPGRTTYVQSRSFSS